MPAGNEAGNQRERRGRKELSFQDGEDRSAQLAKHDPVIFAPAKGRKYNASFIT